MTDFVVNGAVREVIIGIGELPHNLVVSDVVREVIIGTGTANHYMVVNSVVREVIIAPSVGGGGGPMITIIF